MITRLRRRPRRLSARRSRRFLALLGLSLLVLAIAVGEVAADVVNSAAPATLMAERSYVAAVVPVVDESTTLGSWLSEVRNEPGKLGREGILVALGRLLGGAKQVETDFSEVGIPPPASRPARLLAATFQDRATAASELASGVTSALEGNVHGNGLREVTAAGREIGDSDAAYVRFERSLPARVRRHTVALPASRWAVDGTWSQASLDAYVTALSANPALRITHDLHILAVTLQPPALLITPTTTTSTTTSTTTTTTTSTTTTTTTLPGVTTTTSGVTTTTKVKPPPTSTTTTSTTLQLPPADSTSHLAPTRSLQVVLVVINAGDVMERRVVVTATLVPLPPATPPSEKPGSKVSKPPPVRPREVTDALGVLGSGVSRDLALPSFVTVPGTTYLLTVSISAPGGGPGQTDSESLRVQVAG